MGAAASAGHDTTLAPISLAEIKYLLEKNRSSAPVRIRA
jgi:hypothetical protein